MNYIKKYEAGSYRLDPSPKPGTQSNITTNRQSVSSSISNYLNNKTPDVPTYRGGTSSRWDFGKGKGSSSSFSSNYREPTRITIEYSKELSDILSGMERDDNHVAFELMWLSEPTAKYYNGLQIKNVDISSTKGSFDVTIGSRKSPMRIDKFIKYFFKGNYFEYQQIKDFINSYTFITTGEQIADNEIKVPKFSYNPKDVYNTFISLVTKTYPHGHEQEVVKFLPELNIDKYGNYYKIIGGDNPTTMFTSHLDTADRQQKDTKLFLYEEGANKFIETDGNTILGADDKAGVTVMLYMMSNNIPGLYYFFIGEERGGIGSHALSMTYDSFGYLSNIKRCISFDRRDTTSVITEQLGRTCCSDDFANALCAQYNAHGMSLYNDNTGIYTDSASFIEEIAECTNISVGYYREHTGDERQNITYLEKLCKASVKVNWDSLPTVRKVGISEEINRKYRRLIKDIKEIAFENEVKVKSQHDGKVCIVMEMSEGIIEQTYNSLSILQFLLDKHKISQRCFYEEESLKIELR